MNQKRTAKKTSKLLEFIFYGNYFYGVCAAALSVESTLQQRFPLNNSLYFVLVFLITVLYYAYPYIRKSAPSRNPRTNWYTKHYHFMRWNQVVITIILSLAVIFLLLNYWNELWSMQLINWIMIIIFPVTAALYYGVNTISGKYNLRKTGWLKPFVIGFTWAGLVTVYPVLFYSITHHLNYELNEVGILLFLKNFMFITILCIMFDIKDYAADYINRLKTFCCKSGLAQNYFQYSSSPLCIRVMQFCLLCCCSRILFYKNSAECNTLCAYRYSNMVAAQTQVINVLPHCG